MSGEVSDSQSIIEACKKFFPKKFFPTLEVDISFRASIDEFRGSLKKETKSKEVGDDELPGEIMLTNPKQVPSEVSIPYTIDSISIYLPNKTATPYDWHIYISPKLKGYKIDKLRGFKIEETWGREHPEINEFENYLIGLGYGKLTDRLASKI